MPKYLTRTTVVCGALVFFGYNSEHHSEMQYCADCGARGSFSQWRVCDVPIWTTQSPGRPNALSDYMQQHGWPTAHTDWRYVDALDSSPVFGITAWYAGNHFRRIRTRAIDMERLWDATDSFPDLPLLVDRLILKPDVDGLSDEDCIAQMDLIHFINGHSEWQELEQRGIVEDFRRVVAGEFSTPAVRR